MTRAIVGFGAGVVATLMGVTAYCVLRYLAEMRQR